MRALRHRGTDQVFNSQRETDIAAAVHVQFLGCIPVTLRKRDHRIQSVEHRNRRAASTSVDCIYVVEWFLFRSLGLSPFFMWQIYRTIGIAFGNLA